MMNLKEEIGHFNVVERNGINGPKAQNISFGRKDFYKISLLNGKNNIYYADRIFKIQKSALLFVNPKVPYGVEVLEKQQSGFICIFSSGFFFNNLDITQFPLFRPGTNAVFPLDDEQINTFSQIFVRMTQELHSDFIYKYGFLRNLVLDLTFQAMKLLPDMKDQQSHSTSTKRLSFIFADLLEKQFPIESPFQAIKLRTPNAFALKLSVHVNYLNRSLKEATGKTTTELITSRIIQEAKSLLLHTNWNVSEIAWCLGYKGLPHFITSFKAETALTPTSFRLLHQTKASVTRN